jgi:hypothetical protein
MGNSLASGGLEQHHVATTTPQASTPTAFLPDERSPQVAGDGGSPVRASGQSVAFTARSRAPSPFCQPAGTPESQPPGEQPHVMVPAHGWQGKAFPHDSGGATSAVPGVHAKGAGATPSQGMHDHNDEGSRLAASGHVCVLW